MVPGTENCLKGAKIMSYAEQYFKEAVKIIEKIDAAQVEAMAQLVSEVRGVGGRIFFVGVGGSAGNASHAVNDFRKICGIETYTPTDNVSELSARINDEGWETCFAEFLRGSRLSSRDAVFVLSVGGGSAERKVSTNIIAALRYAKEIGATIFGIVGKEGGFT